MKSLSRYWIFVLSLVGGLVLLYIAATLIIIPVYFPTQIEECCRPRERQSFRKEVWQKSAFGDLGRYRMANDIVASRRLVAMSERQIEELLGEPDRKWSRADRTMVAFELVAQRQRPASCALLPKHLFFNIETWALVIELKAGTVVRCTIRST